MLGSHPRPFPEEEPPVRANRPSRTAEAVAWQRATEQRHPPEQRILDDPLARHFLSAPARAALAAYEQSGALADLVRRYSVGLTSYVVARHRCIDEWLLQALAAEDPLFEHVVILGAGYDTRQQRLRTPLRGRAVYEVDHPATGERKRKVLDRLEAEGALSAPRPRQVAVDFQREEWGDRLVQAGFRAGRRTAFVWEGVSMYLPRQAVRSTLQTIAALGAPGSELYMDLWFLLDHPDLRGTAHRLSASLLDVLGEPVLFGIHPEDVGAFLERCGLRLLELADSDQLQARYGRAEHPVYPACYLVRAEVVEAEAAAG
jgi:methyltransferase (TIGR00027 family)